MATVYWYGGDGNWSDYTNHWSNNSGNSPSAPHGSAPGADDDVVFDTNSSVANAAYTVTVNATATCKDFTMAGPGGGNQVTWAGSSGLTISGSLNLSGGTAGINRTGTSGLTFNATSGTKTINLNGVALNNNITFNGSGGTFQFTSDMTNARGLTLTAGTVDFTTNSTTVTLTPSASAILGNFTFYNLTRTVTGASGDSTQIRGDITVTNVLTINGANATTQRMFLFTSNNATFPPGTVSSITLGNIPVLSNLDIQDIQFQSTNSRTISGVTDDGSGKARFTTSAAHGLKTNSVIVIAGTTNYNGAVTVTNVSDTTHFDVSALSYVSSQTGTWTFDFSGITGLSGDCGNNIGATFTSSTDQHWTNVNGGSWSTSANWTSRVPLPQDNAIMDCAFGTSKTVTSDVRRMGSVTWAGATWTTALSWNVSGSVIPYFCGDLILINGLSFTSSSSVMTMLPRKNVNINFANVSYTGGLSIDGGSSNIVTMTGNITTSATQTTYLNSGGLDINGQTLSTGFITGGSYSFLWKDIATGGSIYITGNNGVIFNFQNVYYTPTTLPSITCSYSGSTGTRTLYAGNSLGGTESNSLSFNFTAGTDIIDISASSKYKNLNFTGFGGTVTNRAVTIYGNVTLEGGATFTAGSNAWTLGATSGTKTITSDAKTVEFPITIDGVGGTFQLGDNLTISSDKTLTLNNGVFDINGKALSIGIFSSNNSNTRTLADVSTGGSITVTGSGALVWAFSQGTGLTCTTLPAITLNYSGSTGTRYVAHMTAGPSAGGLVSFSVTAGTDEFRIGSTSSINNLDLTGFAGSVRNESVLVYGNYTIPTGITISAGTNATTFSSTSGTKTITIVPSCDFPITIDGVGGTFQLGADLTLGSTRRLTVTNGTFTCVNGGNNYVLSTGLFTMGGGTTTLGSATHLITGTGTTTWNVTGGTLTASTGTIKFTDSATATGITFVGGGKTYNNVWFARGANTQSHTITGNNTFADFKDDGTGAHSILFTAGSTQTVSTFTVNGNPGAAITINSTSTSVINLTKTGGGNIICNWLNIQHAACLPLGTWFASKSVNNNKVSTAGSGWTFIDSAPMPQFFQ